MPELNLAPDTSARDAVFLAVATAATQPGVPFDERRAAAIGQELLDHLTVLERRAHPLVMLGDPLPEVKAPPGAIGYAQGAYVAGQDVQVTRFDGSPLILDEELPPFYAGEDLQAGQAVAIASWLQGNAVVGAAR